MANAEAGIVTVTIDEELLERLRAAYADRLHLVETNRKLYRRFQKIQARLKAQEAELRRLRRVEEAARAYYNASDPTGSEGECAEAELFSALAAGEGKGE